MLKRLIDGDIPVPYLRQRTGVGAVARPAHLQRPVRSRSAPMLSATLFVCDLVAMGYIFACLPLSSGSIWPWIWGYGVWNAVIQGPFDMSTRAYSVWVGESGGLTVMVVIAFCPRAVLGMATPGEAS